MKNPSEIWDSFGEAKGEKGLMLWESEKA